MTIFFDRDVGIGVPKALLELKVPTPVVYHQQHFRIDSPDDEWMPYVGSMGWMLIGHDSRHHIQQAEISAIRQYRMACFYLWGSEARRWEKALCFLRAYERILAADETTARPYIYRISKSGRLSSVEIQ